MFLLFSVLFGLSNPFSCLSFFPFLKLCFMVHINVLIFQESQLIKHQILVKSGVATKFFFCYLCFAKSEKLSFLGPIFAQHLVGVQEHCKHRHFRTLKKQKCKKYHFEGLLSGPSRGYYLGQVCCNIKMANLAQIITPELLRAFFKNVLKPLFYSVF